MHAGPANRLTRFNAAIAAATAISLIVIPAGRSQIVEKVGAEIRVGVDHGDLRGNDQRALQAAVDEIAGLGGGTVRIGAGRYLMRNALTLRDHVRIIGEPGKTILVPCESFDTLLAADGDCNEREIAVSDASGLRVGDGIAIRDDHNASGFTVTTATLTAKVGERTFRLSAPLYVDYLVSLKARASLAFPVVGGWNVRDVMVEGLTIDSPPSKAEQLDGCRGGGIYLFQCAAITIRNCTVRGYHGDGISFQVSEHVTVEDCACEDNAGLGLHPGSGSQYPVMRRNRSINNGKDGLYVCWRVRHGLFEGNEIRGNKGAGISIGHKDSDNQFRHNIITGSGGPGVLFRPETEPMGAHRNIFEDNRILDNGMAETAKAPKACIVIRGTHHGLVFRKNTIGQSQAAPSGVGILCSDPSSDLQAADNEFRNVQIEIQSRAR